MSVAASWFGVIDRMQTDTCKRPKKGRSDHVCASGRATFRFAHVAVGLVGSLGGLEPQTLKDKLF